MFERVLNTSLDDTSKLDRSIKCVLLSKASVFVAFYSKSKQKLKKIRTLFLRHSFRTVLDRKLKRYHGGFFELEMLEIFTRPLLLKNHY